MRRFIPVIMAAALALARPAVAAAQPVASQRVHPDSLRLTAGPAWHELRSRHFTLYSEPTGHSDRLLLDSLEDAWTHANALLGRNVADTALITVFATASRTRFLRFIAPDVKGLMGRSIDGRDVIILVHNDSVRAYTRHEVMHVIAARAWGFGPRSSGGWLREGLATFADGLCQGVPVSVVARDVLRAHPFLTIRQLITDFPAMQAKARGLAYVLAGSLVDYLWSVRGRDGVRRLYTSTDLLVPPLVPQPGFSVQDTSADILPAWRAYTERAAGGRPGLSPASLQRQGCG